MPENVLTKAIKDYLCDKENITFETNLIRLLTYIYEEENIIGLYQKSDYNELIIAMQKYGLKKDDVDKFIQVWEDYENNKDFDSFLTIYKYIMDMIALKYHNAFISKEEVEKYEKIFFEGRSVQALKEYWDEILYKINNKITFEKEDNNIYNPYTTYLQGKTMDDIKAGGNERFIDKNKQSLKQYKDNELKNNKKNNSIAKNILIIFIVLLVVILGIIAAIIIIKR